MPPRCSGVIDLFVPGRLCLFGEHSDWASGYRVTHPSIARGHCIVAGTDQGLHATASALDGAFEVSSVLEDGTVERVRLPLDEGALDAAARTGGFFRYAAGVAAEVIRGHDVDGVAIEIHSVDLPTRKGLSSSAAACVLVARAFNVVHRLGLSPRDEMELAHAGERRAGSQCGRMDQVCALGRRPALLTFDGEDLEIELLAPAGPLHLLIVDLRSQKDTRRILAELNRCFPDADGEMARGVRDALGPLNAALVAQARDALIAGDARQLGALMRQAQDLFDRAVAPACSELKAPRLHEVLAHPAVAEFAWGGKGVGSQGDGSAQFVARGSDERDALAARLEAEAGVACLPLTLGT
jgi:galactokinase